MRKIRLITALLALTLTPTAFAEDSAACDVIARACVAGGFVEEMTPNKEFWQDCMHPLLLGNTVTGIEIASRDIAACRKAKIASMKVELKELEKVDKKG